MRVLAIQVLCRVQVINLKNIFEFVSLCVIYRVLFIFVRCSINGYFNMLSEASDIIAYDIITALYECIPKLKSCCLMIIYKFDILHEHE